MAISPAERAAVLTYPGNELIDGEWVDGGEGATMTAPAASGTRADQTYRQLRGAPEIHA